MEGKVILEILKRNRKKLKKFGVKKIGIFGSAVRNELNENSDIDVVVEFEQGRGSMKDFTGLIDFLENLFGRRVDILTPEGIETIKIKSIKERIKKEVRYV